MSGSGGSRDFTSKCDHEGEGREVGVMGRERRGEEHFVHSKFTPGGKDSVEKGKSRIRFEK